MLKVSITNADGEVYEILKRQIDGSWTDEDGDMAATSDTMLCRLEMPAMLRDALIWAKAEPKCMEARG